MYKIKSRLLLIFLLTGALSLTMFLVTFRYVQVSQNDFYRLNSANTELECIFLKDVKVTRDFFSNETINSDYFKTGKSRYLDQHDSMQILLNVKIAEIASLAADHTTEISGKYDQLSAQLKLYSGLFDSTVTYINLRGYKDYDVEGRMRNYAHKVEALDLGDDHTAVMRLRRHEKDFIIRQDRTYQQKLHAEAQNILAMISMDGKKSLSEKENECALVNNYTAAFDSLVNYDELIGIKSQNGLKKRIDVQVDNISALIEDINTFTYRESQALMNNIVLTTILVLVLLNTLVVILCFGFSTGITTPINQLKDKINRFIENGFTKTEKDAISNRKDEIGVLSRQFELMEDHIVMQMEMLRQQNTELKTLIYRASHDLRSPFTSIQGAVNYAMRNVKDKDTLEILEKIKTTTVNFNDVVEELTMVSEIKSAVTVAKPIDFSDVVKKSMSGLDSLPGYDRVVFTTEINVQSEFRTDERLLRMSLRNLLENGIKYQDRRKNETHVKLRIEETQPGMIALSVSDNGIGIKKEYQERVFEMFYRATDVSTGTGLGLYIVQSAIQKLSGVMEMQSEEGSGTKFVMYLPDLIAISKENKSPLVRPHTERQMVILNYVNHQDVR